MYCSNVYYWRKYELENELQWLWDKSGMLKFDFETSSGQLLLTLSLWLFFIFFQFFEKISISHLDGDWFSKSLFHEYFTNKNWPKSSNQTSATNFRIRVANGLEIKKNDTNNKIIDIQLILVFDIIFNPQSVLWPIHESRFPPWFGFQAKINFN